MLTLLQFIVAKLTTNFNAIADLIKASPAFLYADGRFNEKQMQKQQIRIEDLYAKVRKHGMSSLDEVEAIVLKGNGSLSIVKKEEDSSKETLRGIKE
ncbi:YetF domain-containing protein [Planococcus lenghuensis]|nr:YetF domain-containing protein [Planococcus lenghuensis]